MLLVVTYFAPKRTPYSPAVQGFKEDGTTPRKIDSREVIKGNDGIGYFADDNSPIGEYLAECKRLKQEREQTRKQNRQILKSRQDLELNQVPRAVKDGHKHLYDWLQEQKGDQVA